MKRVKILLLIFVIFSIMLPIYGIEVPDEWYWKAIETLEKSEKHREDLQGQVDLLTVELNQTERQLDIYRQKYNAQKGFYGGGGASYSFLGAKYPIGVNGMLQYKFDRWALYMTGGYANGLYIGAGGIIKIGW